MTISFAFKIRTGPYETCKTLLRRNATKFRIHLIGSVIKLNRISEVLMHRRFFENLVMDKNFKPKYNFTYSTDTKVPRNKISSKFDRIAGVFFCFEIKEKLHKL